MALFKAWPGYPVARTAKDEILNKGRASETYIAYMFNRTQSMFEYEGLPDTIPQRMLELYLQSNGNVCVAKANGDLYAFVGGLGGEPDAYYQPTLYVVANPYLNLTKEYKIDKECVVVRNDSLMLGLSPMFTRYALQLTENDISLWRASINTRAMTLVAGGTDPVKKAADVFFDKLEQGYLGAVGDNAFMEALKTYPINGASASNYITQLIELRQYWLAQWFQDLGLNSNHNMKREAINESEAGMNEDALLPLVDDMLRNRIEGVEKINAMFGTNITVRVASSWENVKERAEVQEEPQEEEQETNEEEVKEDVGEPENDA